MQINLSDVEKVTLEDRRGYLTLVITTLRDVRLILRKTEGIKEWCKSIEHLCKIEKQKRMRKSYEEFPNKRQATDSYGFNDWLVARDKIGKRII